MSGIIALRALKLAIFIAIVAIIAEAFFVLGMRLSGQTVPFTSFWALGMFSTMIGFIPTQPSPSRVSSAPISLAGRVMLVTEIGLSLLTKGVARCMILATGVVADFTQGLEPPAPVRPAWGPTPPPPERPIAWITAHSMQIRDAARLSEACARLLSGYAQIRRLSDRQYSVRYTDNLDRGKKRRRATSVTHRFAVRGEQTPSAFMPDEAGDAVQSEHHA